MSREGRAAEDIWAEALRTAELLDSAYAEPHERIQRTIYTQITRGEPLRLEGQDVESLANYVSDAIILVGLLKQLDRRGVRVSERSSYLGS